MSGEELKAKAREAALKLADMPVKGLRVGEKPYVVMHALDRDALVDLLAEVAHPLPEQPQEGWRTIDSAPKDGTTIDVWRDGSRETVYWGFPPHCCGEMGQHCDSDWHSLKKPGWICSTFGEYVGGKHDPFTHWMPLPSPPSTETKESGE